MHTFPLNKIPFDTTAIPARIVNTFEEALTCRANDCYTAAGIMIRKTLEVLCEELEIRGGSLYERMQQIGGRVILPPELLEGLNDIRLLGNDAAHIESKTYTTISHEEIDLSIEILKEVMKAIYQYDTLLGRLRALKKGATPSE